MERLIVAACLKNFADGAQPACVNMPNPALDFHRRFAGHAHPEQLHLPHRLRLPDVPQTADFPYVFPDKNRVLLYFCSSVLKPSETILY